MPVKNSLHLVQLAKKQASGAPLTLRSRGFQKEGNGGPITIDFLPCFRSNQIYVV